jgi:hypothetical protein
MRVACWITKATDTRSEYVYLLFLLGERVSLLRLYVHFLSILTCFMLTFGVKQ